MYDVTIKGGRLVDPGQGIDGYLDVGITDGRIAAIEPAIEAGGAGCSIDASGKIITPGLVDLHTHVYWGATIWGIDVNQIAPVTGTTTFVDAGTAGAYTFPALRKFIIEPATPQVLAYLNVSSIGLAHFTYEVSNLSYVDPDVAIEAAENNREHIVGIKARIDSLTTGEHGVIPLRRAVETAEALKLPLMVHIGRRPPELRDILDLMRPGDVLTHCYTGGPGKNQLVDEAGKVHDFVLKAGRLRDPAGHRAWLGKLQLRVGGTTTRPRYRTRCDKHRRASVQRGRPDEGYAHDDVEVPEPGFIPSGRYREDNGRPRAGDWPGHRYAESGAAGRRCRI